MRRVRLTEGQLHNVIRHAVNEALDDDEPSFKTQTDYILKGMFIRRSSVSGNDEEPEREWNENIKTCSLPTLIKSLCEKHDLIFDMHSLFYDLGDDTYIYTSVYPHNKPSFKTEYIFKIRKETTDLKYQWPSYSKSLKKSMLLWLKMLREPKRFKKDFRLLMKS
jgi:hypothetical protein